MTWQSVLGYVLTSLVGPLVGWLCGHYGQTELGGVLAVGIAGLGSRLLHTADPPTGKGAAPTQLMPLLLLLPFLGGGCAFLQKPGTQKVIKCTGDVLDSCKADVGPLLACLDVSNPTPCLMAIVNAGSCATAEAMACKVKAATEAPVIMTFVSPTSEEEARAERRRAAAKRFYGDVGVTPEAP